MLSHRIRPVSEILAPHVEHLWVVRGYLPARWRNMILPDGAMELIVNLGDPQELCARDNPAKHTIFRQSWVSGERTTPIGYVHLVGVRLRNSRRIRKSHRHWSRTLHSMLRPRQRRCRT